MFFIHFDNSVNLVFQKRVKMQFLGHISRLMIDLHILPKVESNEIIEEIVKDGSKLLVVQALQRAAKNFDEMTDDTSADLLLQVKSIFWLSHEKLVYSGA